MTGSTARRLGAWALLGALGAVGCAGSPPAPDSRRTHSAATTPGGDVAWIEVTILEQAVVQAEAADRAGRMGFDAAEAERRGKQAWLDLHGKAEGGPVLEVWMSTTCERCLDFREWGWSLVAGRRGGGGDGDARRPRWTESEVMRQQEEVMTVLDASRKVTRSWVRGRLAFARSDVPADGRLDLHLARPEKWASPIAVTWWRGRLEPMERVAAWFAGGAR